MKAPKRILIAEDEHIVALDLRGVLEDLEYEVVGTAASAADVLRKVEAERPDLILMDIKLRGGTDGIHAATVLRAQYQIPIVYLTANSDSNMLHRALETEPAGYLVKPYNAGTLRTTIEVAFRRHGSELALRRAHDLETHQHEEHAATLGDLAESLRRESITDSLTQLYNRRYLDLALKRELSLAHREGHAVGLILLDLDRFKALNDTFGHAAGDVALRAVADVLRSRIRLYDVACRYGGEEMIIVVPGAQSAGALALAEQLRAGIEQLTIEYNGKRLARITASFGVSSFPGDASEPDVLLQIADAALYRAKAAGRNRVVCAATSD